MKARDVAIAIFHDNNFNIAIQERGSYSKSGEKYGFWGGCLKKGETPQQAIVREIEEELGFVPSKLDYWTTYKYKAVKDKQEWLIRLFVFLSPLDKSVKKAKVREGEGVVVMDIDRAIKEMPKEDSGLLKRLKTKLG